MTVTFLTLAFSQLWHVFNLRHPDAGIFRNEITRSPWVWGAIGFCAFLLVLSVYLPQIRNVLGLARPDLAMWGLAILASLAPLVIIQSAQGLSRLARGTAR